MAETITIEDLRRAIEAGTVTVLEALPRPYFDNEHLPGARNLPLDDLEALAPALVPDLDAPVVTYCANTACGNSADAAERLRDLGYTDVRTYPGGKQEWIEAGLPVEAAG